MSSTLAQRPLTAAALLAGVLASGCAASPLSLARMGRLQEAFDALDDTDVAAQQPILRAILDEEAPVLTLEAIEDDALARMLGGHTARMLLPAWVLLRANVTTRGRVLPYTRFVLEIGRDKLEVPSFAMVQTEGIASATGERLPEGHKYSKYRSGLCDAIGLFCLALPPIALLTIEKSGEGYLPPSESDFRREAPRAMHLTDVLADQCTAPGTCTRYLLLRRPRREDEALSVRTRVALRRRAPGPYDRYDDLSVLVTAPIPQGPRLSARLPISLSVSRLPGAALSRYDQPPLPAGFCAGWKDDDQKKGEGPCLVDLVPLKKGETSSFGLTPPPPPASLGTPAESAAKRPWWVADDAYAPRGTAPSKPMEDAAADAALAACRFDFHAIPHGWLRLAAPPPGVWARLDTPATLIPLAHLAKDRALDVEVWDDDSGQRRLVASATLERRGASLVGKKLRTSRDRPFPFDGVTCALYDRAAVEAEVAARWPAAVDALDLAAEDAVSFDVDVNEEGLRFPSPRFTPARESINKIASLIGWSDPRVVTLVARFEAAHVSAGARVKAALKKAAGTARDIKIKGQLKDNPDYAIRVLGVRCADPAPCGLEVEITPDKASGGPVRGLTLKLITDSGYIVPVSLPKDLSIPAGETRTVVITPDLRSPVPPGDKPWALLHHQFFSRWLHLPP